MKEFHRDISVHLTSKNQERSRNELPRSKLTGYQNKSRITCSVVTPACL